MGTVNAIQLRAQDRKEVERILSQFVPNEEVWAYGSRVDGSGHELSDLDLVIRHPADLKQKQAGVLDELKEAFPKLASVIDKRCERVLKLQEARLPWIDDMGAPLDEED